MSDGSIKKAIHPDVLKDIKSHIAQAMPMAEEGWESAPKSEDALSGDFGGSLRTKWSEVREVGGMAWRWRIKHRKFSGQSEEGPTGADGIVQIEVDTFQVAVSQAGPETVKLENVEPARSFRKGMLYQAKRHDSHEAKSVLVGQLKKIEEVSPGDGSYFEYSPNGYHAARAKEVLAVEGFSKQLDKKNFPSIGDFLSNEFLECKVGLEGMFVDFDSETLFVPHDNDSIAKVKADMKHGIGIEVRGFAMTQFDENA